MKIPVYHYEAITEHEFSIHTDLTTGKKTYVMGRDLRKMEVPKGYMFRAPLIWNGKKRNIKKIKGQWYLITKCVKSIDSKNINSYTASSSLTERN